jgi:tetratricopeptide (TPR) repeat protein
VRLLSDRGPMLDGAALPESVQALIAARLDTLSPSRKSLLHDAAVLGKVFWAGALAEMGGRERGDVELALHELARKELVRPLRTASMEGESEYSFWHLLVRDVAYSQIPRAERARRHRAAARWIERKAGERVEDLAEVLAYHYLQALELAESAGDEAQVGELRKPAARLLALAGERALGLDTAQAEARLARALELAPAEGPERHDLLVRWADAVSQAGRPREAAEVLDEVLSTLQRQREPGAAAAALQLRSRVSLRLGDGRHVALAAEAVRLLEGEAPGAALVAAYGQLANAQMIAGEYEAVITAADRAAALANAMGLPVPARALGYRGHARVYLGDIGGLDEMEGALALLTEAGAGREAAGLQNNLAIARYPFEGPSSSLAAFENAIAFCEERGLVEIADLVAANFPGLLVELGRSEEALAQANRLGAAFEMRGNVHDLGEIRATELAVAVARGDGNLLADADWLVETGRALHASDLTPFVFAHAAAALARDAPERGRELLAEIDAVKGVSETPYYARTLPGMIRTALALGASDLGRRLAERVRPRYPLEEHALLAARASLAEQAGDRAAAAALYAEAAEGWRGFGNVPEHAYALLGCGRCLHALGDATAAASLREARELFGSMGYTPAMGEAEALLAEPAAAPTS